MQASVVERVRTARQDEHPPGSFDSAPPNVVSHDKSVRRFAQDDDFAGVLKKTSRTDFVRVLKKSSPIS